MIYMKKKQEQTFTINKEKVTNSHKITVLKSDFQSSYKIAVLTSDPQSIIWHRLDLLNDFKKAGHDVLIVCPGNDSWEKIFSKYGFRYKYINLKRNGINPFTDIRTYFDYIKILKEEKPDKVFSYQAKAVAYGCWAAGKCGISEVYALLSGLGTILRNGRKTKKQSLLFFVLKQLYIKAFNCSKVVIFQNDDDRKKMLNMTSMSLEKTAMTNGSGVDIDVFKEKPLPPTPAFLFIGRLVRDKGLCEYLEACKIIKSKYENIRCLLVGPFDTNPSAINMTELKPYIDDNVIEYVSEQKDVKPFISQCSTYILPSYHEGTPRSVLQAMAMGRAIITTDAPGCRETVVDGENGFLVSVRNVDAIVEKMELLINNPKLNRQMGKKSRICAEEKYDVRKVNKVIFETMGLNYEAKIA